MWEKEKGTPMVLPKRSWNIGYRCSRAPNVRINYLPGVAGTGGREDQGRTIGGYAGSDPLKSDNLREFHRPIQQWILQTYKNWRRFKWEEAESRKKFS
jgi:hypothetical protein